MDDQSIQHVPGSSGHELHRVPRPFFVIPIFGRHQPKKSEEKEDKDEEWVVVKFEEDEKNDRGERYVITNDSAVVSQLQNKPFYWNTTDKGSKIDAITHLHEFPLWEEAAFYDPKEDPDMALYLRKSTPSPNVTQIQYSREDFKLEMY